MPDLRVLAIASEAREFRGILRNCGNVVRLDWPAAFARRAEWNGNCMVCIANGPGFQLARRAVEVASSKERFNAVVSTGFCGGLNPELQVGDIVVASSILDVRSGRRYPASPVHTSLQVVEGTIVSQDRVASTAVDKGRLREQFGAEAVEMEAAVVAGFAQEENAAFYCIRTVSDRASHEFEIDLNEMRQADGSFNKVRILWEAIKRPRTRIGELMRLNAQCRSAEERLGEFFANSNIA